MIRFQRESGCPDLDLIGDLGVAFRHKNWLLTPASPCPHPIYPGECVDFFSRKVRTPGAWLAQPYCPVSWLDPCSVLWLVRWVYGLVYVTLGGRDCYSLLFPNKDAILTVSPLGIEKGYCVCPEVIGRF